jgi:hypothetical protein
MSRVQLSINVSNFDAAVWFLLPAVRRGARQTPARLCELVAGRPAAEAGGELAR